jgi:hypothetical protein
MLVTLLIRPVTSRHFRRPQCPGGLKRGCAAFSPSPCGAGPGQPVLQPVEAASGAHAALHAPDEARRLGRRDLAACGGGQHSDQRLCGIRMRAHLRQVELDTLGAVDRSGPRRHEWLRQQQLRLAAEQRYRGVRVGARR